MERRWDIDAKTRWDIEEEEKRRAEMGEWHVTIDECCSCVLPKGKEHIKYNWEEVFKIATTVCVWHRELKADVEKSKAKKSTG